MFKTWSINSLLKLWSFATIFAIVVIASVAIYTNNVFSTSQSNLTEKVLPIENASRQINAVASLFITRQKQIIASHSLDTLSGVTPRIELENEFSIQWQQIASSVNNKDDKKIVDSLQEHYKQFLLVDSALLELISQQHNIQSLLKKKTKQVEQLEQKIQNQVEAITGQIHLQRSLEQRTAQKTKKSFPSVNTEYATREQEIIQKLSYSVRLNVLQISYLTQKLMLSENEDVLLSIRDNDIRQHQTILESVLSQLKVKLAGNEQLLGEISLLEQGVAELIDIVLDNDSAIYKLRLKQLQNNALSSKEQQSSIATLKVITAKLDELASIVREKSLHAVTKATQIVDRAQWLIIALTSCITLGMMWFVISIAHRINSPLSELRSAMHALSYGQFETRLNVSSGKSEFAVISADFNLFATNTQNLIDDLAEAKDTLQVREQHITAILNGVPEAILTLTSDGIIHSTNPAAEQVLKANEQTLKGLSLNTFLADEKYKQFSLDDIRSILAKGRELEGLDYNKQPFSMSLTLNHLSSLKEDIWVCVISDITAWKQAEQNLTKTSSELDAILENAMVGIAFIKNRTVLRVNSKFEQLFLTNRSLIEGQSTRCLYASEEIYDQMGEDAYNALTNGESFVGEVRLVRQDGGLFWGMMSGKALDASDPQAGSIWLFEDITSQRENDEKLRRLASVDPLTGLPNRAVFNDRLDHAIHKAHRNSARIAVFFIDLDHFKHINDSLGHKAGDILLCEVAKRLKSCIREGDTVARLGGDEFTVILEEIRSAQHVGGVADKVLSSIALPYNIDGTEVTISPSIGISLYPADGRDVDLLLRNADAAMYHAKDTGRNNFQFYSGDMNAQAARRLAMETSLRRAIEQNEFFLHFQPQIDLDTGIIAGAEALLRWKNDKWGEVSPVEFIPILEDSGLISEVGKLVIKQAIRAYLSLKDKLVPEFQMAVNLSGRQFQGGQLASFIEDELAATGMFAKNLELEITESILMDDTDLAVTTLNSLSELGITLAIDDFGTGYSSLSYLKRFPLNVLKIDRTFVRDVNIDEDDAAIVEAIIAMSRRLNLKVIAEGVETDEQLQFLENNHCDRVQGYFFSKPLSIEEFSLFVDNNSILLTHNK